MIYHPLFSVGSSVICENANNTLICGGYNATWMLLEVELFLEQVDLKLNLSLLEQGTVINIHTANYGRTDRSTCSIRRPASQTAKTDCYSSNSQPIVTDEWVLLFYKFSLNAFFYYFFFVIIEMSVKGLFYFSFYRCEGINICVLVASNGVFSDPCVGTSKFLYVSYSCVAICKCYCVSWLFVFYNLVFRIIQDTRLMALFMVHFFAFLQNTTSGLVDFRFKPI